MNLKSILVRSLLLGLAGGLSAYVLAWGFFTTHPEVGMEPASARSIAFWAVPLVFVGSVIYFGASNRRR